MDRRREKGRVKEWEKKDREGKVIEEARKG